MNFFNFHALNLCAPIVFIFGMFFPLSFQHWLIFIAIIIIFFPFNFSVFNKLLVFAALGMGRGMLIHENDEIYSYKRTSFIADIQDFKIKEHGAYIVIDNIKFDPTFHPNRSIPLSTKSKNTSNDTYEIDKNPILPKTAVMKIKVTDLEKIVPKNAENGNDAIYHAIPSNLQTETESKRKQKPKFELDVDKINLANIKQAKFVGRFMVATPGAMPQVAHKKQIMGLADEMQVTKIEKHSFKTIMREKFNKSLSKNSAQMAKAIVLSDTFAIPKKLRAMFQDAGIAHLLGVSVLNIAILGMIFYFLFRKFIGFAFYKLALAIPLDIIGKLAALFLTAAYCYLVGFEYPLVRSFLMSSFAILALYFGRNRNLETLLWSGTIILAIKPDAIYDIGFQLSFGAVLGLCCATNITISNKFLRILTQSFTSTFFASLIIIPISIFQFHTTSIQPFLANMIAIPFVSFIITPLSLVWMILTSINLEYLVSFLLDYSFIALTKIAEYTAPLGINIHIDPIYAYGCIALVTCIAFFAIFIKDKIKYAFLAIGISCFISSIIFKPKKPFILVHPYAISLVLNDFIVIYPKNNFVADIWADAYALKSFDGKNTQYFAKDKCGKIVVYVPTGSKTNPHEKKAIGILLFEPKHPANIKTDLLFVIPYAELAKKTQLILVE